jgi:flagellar basal-body rod protein FlgB
MVNRNELMKYLQAGLDAAQLRQKVVANNLANINTPGYRRGAVDFEARLAEALDSGRPLELQRVLPEVHRPHDTPVNDLGNDVSLEGEIAQLMRNSTRVKLMLKVMKKHQQQLSTAMGSSS